MERSGVVFMVLISMRQIPSLLIHSLSAMLNGEPERKSNYSGKAWAGSSHAGVQLKESLSIQQGLLSSGLELNPGMTVSPKNCILTDNWVYL